MEQTITEENNTEQPEWIRLILTMLEKQRSKTHESTN